MTSTKPFVLGTTERERVILVALTKNLNAKKLFNYKDFSKEKTIFPVDSIFDERK